MTTTINSNMKKTSSFSVISKTSSSPSKAMSSNGLHPSVSSAAVAASEEKKKKTEEEEEEDDELDASEMQVSSMHASRGSNRNVKFIQHLTGGNNRPTNAPLQQPSANTGLGSSFQKQQAQQPMMFVNSTVEHMQNQLQRSNTSSPQTLQGGDVTAFESCNAALQMSLEGKKKRTRTTPEQLRILQRFFQSDPMPNSVARMALAKRLGMTARAVQVWFQNRRAKEKLENRRQSQVDLVGDSDGNANDLFSQQSLSKHHHQSLVTHQSNGAFMDFRYHQQQQHGASSLLNCPMPSSSASADQLMGAMHGNRHPRHIAVRRSRAQSLQMYPSSSSSDGPSKWIFTEEQLSAASSSSSRSQNHQQQHPASLAVPFPNAAVTTQQTSRDYRMLLTEAPLSTNAATISTATALSPVFGEQAASYIIEDDSLDTSVNDSMQTLQDPSSMRDYLYSRMEQPPVALNTNHGEEDEENDSDDDGVDMSQPATNFFDLFANTSTTTSVDTMENDSTAAAQHNRHHLLRFASLPAMNRGEFSSTNHHHHRRRSSPRLLVTFDGKGHLAPAMVMHVDPSVSSSPMKPSSMDEMVDSYKSSDFMSLDSTVAGNKLDVTMDFVPIKNASPILSSSFPHFKGTRSMRVYSSPNAKDSFVTGVDSSSSSSAGSAWWSLFNSQPSSAIGGMVTATSSASQEPISHMDQKTAHEYLEQLLDSSTASSMDRHSLSSGNEIVRQSDRDINCCSPAPQPNDDVPLTDQWGGAVHGGTNAMLIMAQAAAAATTSTLSAGALLVDQHQHHNILPLHHRQ